MPTLLSHPIGPTGLGLMGMTWRVTPQPFSASHTTLTSSLSTSPPTNFWNGGEIYGPSTANSLHLLKEYFTLHPQHASQVLLSIKGGCLPGQLIPDGTAAGVRRSVEECNRILAGTKKIDIFESARVDPKVPIEETMRAYKALIEEGAIGAVGLSEVSAATIRRAANVVPIAAVEVELSLWATDIMRNGVLEACRDLGILIAAYSPLARGMLTEEPIKVAELPEGDFRKGLPKFQEGVVEHNMQVTAEVRKLAERKGCTLPQVALAWVRQIGARYGGVMIVPIPGATTVERVRENSEVVELTEEEMNELQGVVERVEVKGERYGGHAAALIEG
ncbi:MAG: hypothetical protein Q9160_000877 [Pyrenula sp. 1 TL-2023]